MNPNSRMRTALSRVVLIGVVTLAVAVPVRAQVQTQQTVTDGASSKSVTVERGEVVWVSGSNLMIKREKDGELQYFPDIPSTARATVGGKQLSVYDLKPGMKLERTTIVTTTPRTIRTVRSVSGTVFRKLPPNQVILTLPGQGNQLFTVPRDQKFMVDGKETDVAGLQEGMRITATAVSDKAENVVAKQVTTTGVAPPPPAPPAPPPPNVVLLIVEAPAPVQARAPAPVATAGALPAQLPKTASPLPLLGLAGLALCGASIAMRMLRK